MGADGGSIAGRAELVRTAKRAVALHSVKEVAKESANSCALSQDPLRAPVVVCAMGLLYNKDALIEYLLSKQKFPHFSHIQSIKDVSPANIQWNDKAASTAAAAATAGESAFASAISASDASSEARSLYSCPITALPSNGTNRFVCMQPCGCVLSERAFRQVGSGAGAKIDSCIACGHKLAPDTPPPAIAASAAAAAAASASSSDSAAASSSASPSAVSSFHHPSYLTLFPGPEETLYLRALMAERIKQREADKIAKKQAKKAGTTAAAASTTGAAMADASVDAAGTSGSHKRKIEDSDASATAADSASSAPGNGTAGSSTSTAAAASSSAASSSAAASAPRAKKPHLAGAHAALVSSKTGNVLSDHVRAITENAAKLVAERRKESAKFDSMFLTQQQIAATRFDPISTKPASLMGQL